MKKLIFAFTCLLFVIPCRARIITVDDNGPADFNNIQAAINDANSGDVVFVAAGTYYENISMKNGVTVTGAGADVTVIDGGENGHVVVFNSASGTISGFTITNSGNWAGYLSGIFTSQCTVIIKSNIITNNFRGISLSSGSDAVISGNKIINNNSYGIRIVTQSSSVITDNVIAHNSRSGIRCSGDSSAPFIINNTISHNGFCGIQSSPTSNQSISNNIITNNEYGILAIGDDQSPVPLLHITYNNVSNNTNTNYWEEYGYIGPLGFSGPFTPQPGTGETEQNPLFAEPYKGDYHLKSQAGRWNQNSQSWVLDEVTSPCIDAGNPGCPLGDEPNDVNNVRINMGAYGGTAEASKSPANWRSIADLTNDWVVDSNDLRVFVDYWLQTGECIPSDLNRSQSVDFNDFAIFGLQWSYPTAFEAGMTFHVDDCNMEAGLNWTAAEESNEPRFSVWVEGRYIYFEDQMYANCCPEELGLDKEINGNQITLYEIGYGGMCLCMCYFPITATLGPFEDGTYTVEVYDNYGNSLGVVEVTIGGSTGPDITFQIDDCSLFSAAGHESETRFTVTVEGLYVHFEDTMVANCCPDELGLEMTIEDDLITIYETEYTSEGCRCMCFYPVSATLGPFEPGTYTLEVYEYHDGFIGSTSVVIDPPQKPCAPFIRE